MMTSAATVATVMVALLALTSMATPVAAVANPPTMNCTAALPCYNGGSCVNVTGSTFADTTCACVNGFEGYFCEVAPESTPALSVLDVQVIVGAVAFVVGILVAACLGWVRMRWMARGGSSEAETGKSLNFGTGHVRAASPVTFPAKPRNVPRSSQNQV